MMHVMIIQVRLFRHSTLDDNEFVLKLLSSYAEVYQNSYYVIFPSARRLGNDY